jgi:hypothetical protein
LKYNSKKSEGDPCIFNKIHGRLGYLTVFIFLNILFKIMLMCCKCVVGNLHSHEGKENFQL